MANGSKGIIFDTASEKSNKNTMGISPAALGKRELVKPSLWCPKSDIEFDPWCDPDNPKSIIYKDVAKAGCVLKSEFSKTPLTRSKNCANFDMELYYKLELVHKTGSFHERSALYSLLMLTPEQRLAGVITASLGNWATALAYEGQRLHIRVTVVLPIPTLNGIIEKCQEYGANVVLYGYNFAEAKHQAFVMIADSGMSYINGYDHPHVIAGSGTIGLEILEQMPQTDVIIVPVGGGGLIAGIAAAVKHLKPLVQIYGIEPNKSCSFFKAMENERPYQTAVTKSVAVSLGVPRAGCNAYHTAMSLIDKMVLVDDDWITRAVLHLVEMEKLVAEGAGAASLSAILSVPNILPELKGKNVVCVISGGANIDNYILTRCLERARSIEGRIVKVTIKLHDQGTKDHLRVLSMIANVGVNVLNIHFEKPWMEDIFHSTYLNLTCETRGLEYAWTFKRVMEQLFPNICEFVEEPYSPIPTCCCFPRKKF